MSDTNPARRHSRALERLAPRLDVSMGHLVQEGITLVLARHKQPQER